MRKHHYLHLLAVVGLSIFLNGCATDRTKIGDYSQKAVFSSKGTSYKVGKPYKVLGSWYYPEENFSYNQTGTASWYGKDFHAKYTANGEVYDMNTLTAAHPTLPLPSIVKVTNLENGRSLILRVNDRGPFAKNRIIDVSKRSAQLLGFEQQGTTKVRVEIMAEESKKLKNAILGNTSEVITVDHSTSAPVSSSAAQSTASGSTITSGPLQAIGAKSTTASTSAKTGKYFVQAGAFTQQGMAEDLQILLAQFGECKTVIADVAGNRYYRVRLGPYTTEAQAGDALNKVHNYGISNAKVVKD